jgi:hypothetical protein
MKAKDKGKSDEMDKMLKQKMNQEQKIGNWMWVFR